MSQPVAQPRRTLYVGIHRCPCGEMLVDVQNPDGSLRAGCAKCEPLELLHLVRQIFVVKEVP